jgi:signal peptidase II
VTDADPSSPPGPATEPAAPHPFAVKVGVLVTAALLVLDQATKELAESLLAPGAFVPWLGARMGWQLVYNPGGAFGIPAPAWLFLVVTVVVLILVVRALPQASSLTAAVAFGMLLAGALGNALDRVLRPGDPNVVFGGGYVVDFVAWGSFPRFNVADSAITVGFVLLVIALWLEERRGTDGAETSVADPHVASSEATPPSEEPVRRDARPDDGTPR